MKHTISACMVALIILSTFSLAFNVQVSRSSQPLADPPLTEWAQSYGGTNMDTAQALVRTSDGGYAIAGYTNSYGAGQQDAWLVKTDANGNTQWSQTYGGAGTDIANALVQTADGGYALAGYTNSYGAGGVDFWLVKTDSSGNQQWSKTYGGTTTDIANALVQTADGGYALGGMTVSYCVGEADFWLVKTDGNGNAQWTHAYGGAVHEEGQSLVQTVDGGYALAGWTNSYGAGANDMWLVRTDSAGNLQWSKTYGEAWYDEAWALVRTIDGGYALAGETVASVNSPTNSYLVKTDGNGNTQWDKTYEGSVHNLASALVQTTDGGYALAGYAYPPANIYCDFWLVKTDSSGNQQWSKTCGGADNHDMAKALVQTVDGGYAVAGYTQSYGAGGSDFWLVKLGSTSPPPTYSLTITVTAGGTTSPTPGVYECTVGTVVAITALPYTGYQFDHWELDSVNVGSANPYSVTMNTAHTLRAVFVSAPESCGWPVLIAPLQISSSAGYNIGDTLTARFTIQNQGTAAIHLDKLLLGGRFNGGTLPGGGFPDFSYSSVTLQVGQTYQYEGTLYLTEAGYYQFFVAYYIANPTEAEKQLLDPNNWNACIDLAPGLSDCHRTWSRNISGLAQVPQTVPIAGKGIWIYHIWLYGNPDTIIARLELAKVKWVAIKCGDSNSYYLRPGGQLADWADSYGGFPQIISKFHQRGIKVLGTHFACSYNMWSDLPGVTELDVANNILSISGIDGLLINAENDSIEAAMDNYRIYRDYLTGLRSSHPNDFIAYNSYDSAPPDWSTRVGLHDLFTTYCNASMPEVYWTVHGRTPTEELIFMEGSDGIGKSVNGKLVDKWHGKPIMPMGISGPAWDLGSREINPGEIKQFCDTSFAHGYSAVSLYAYHIMHSDPDECKVPQVWKWTEYSGCFNPDTKIMGQCPIDLVVTDPDGLIISKTLNEVPGALYTELDLNGDNDTVVEVSILHKKLGDYFVTVIPQANASSNDTYSLEFSALNMTATLAHNVSISNIPSESYVATLTETTIVPRTSAHDVGIDRFRALKTIVGQDQVLSLDVRIRNYGDNVEHFNLTLYSNSSMIANLENITLASSASFLTTFRWNTTGYVKGNYIISVVVDPVLGETYTEDNILIGIWVIVTIPGDVDGDRDVDIYDVVKITGIYHSKLGDPQFNPNSDLDDDGEIKIYDVVMCTSHYRQNW